MKTELRRELLDGVPLVCLIIENDDGRNSLHVFFQKFEAIFVHDHAIGEEPVIDEEHEAYTLADAGRLLMKWAAARSA